AAPVGELGLPSIVFGLADEPQRGGLRQEKVALAEIASKPVTSSFIQTARKKPSIKRPACGRQPALAVAAASSIRPRCNLAASIDEIRRPPVLFSALRSRFGDPRFSLNAEARDG